MVLKLQHFLEMASRRIALRLKFVRRLSCEMEEKEGEGVLASVRFVSGY